MSEHRTIFSMLHCYNLFMFSEKIKLCRHTGLDRAFDIMAETFKIIKIHQMQLKKAEPKKKIEMDCNEILRQAVIVSLYIFMYYVLFFHISRIDGMQEGSETLSRRPWSLGNPQLEKLPGLL